MDLEQRMTGVFVETNLESVRSVLAEVCEIPIEKLVPGNGELSLENDQIEFYVYPDEPGEITDYLMTCQFLGSNEDLLQFVEKLSQRLLAEGMIYDFEVYQETEEGEMIGESISFRHKDYGQVTG